MLKPFFSLQKQQLASPNPCLLSELWQGRRQHLSCALFPWLLLGLSLYKSFVCFHFSAQQLCFKGTSCLIATYWILLSDCCKFSKTELCGLRGIVPGRTTADYFRKASVFYERRSAFVDKGREQRNLFSERLWWSCRARSWHLEEG